MYDALEAILLKYLDPSLLTEPAAAQETVEDDSDRPLVIAISPSPEKLRSIKEFIGNKYKGVYVRDTESASKYLEKNKNK